MSDLQKYYQEKYGKPSQEPPKASVFEGGQKMGAAFHDEMVKLDKAADKKKGEASK